MSDVEFLRHLGLPPDREIDGSVTERMNAAREWFDTHARPWTTVVTCVVSEVRSGEVTIRSTGGREIVLRSELLASGFEKAGVDRVAIAAVSAGAEIDLEIARAWSEDRPDDALFLNAWGSVVVESARAAVHEELRAASRKRGGELLPAYSPGYDGWHLADQRRLFEAIHCDLDASGRCGPLEVLESGGLKPSKSTLVLFAETGRPISERDEFWSSLLGELSARQPVRYAFPRKALERWSRERLSLERHSERELRARFRFDGTTCTNMGLEFALDFEIELETTDAAASCRVLSARCRPASNDRGHLGMCEYRSAPERFLREVDTSCPWVGATLDAAFDGEPHSLASGCLCTRGAREHKWRLVLQSIHFRLESRAESIQSIRKEDVDG